MQWFLKLAPEMQVTIALQAIGVVFSSGVWYATIRFLSKRVREHDEHFKAHDDKLGEHGERISAVEAEVSYRR